MSHLRTLQAAAIELLGRPDQHGSDNYGAILTANLYGKLDQPGQSRLRDAGQGLWDAYQASLAPADAHPSIHHRQHRLIALAEGVRRTIEEGVFNSIYENGPRTGIPDGVLKRMTAIELQARQALAGFDAVFADAPMDPKEQVLATLARIEDELWDQLDYSDRDPALVEAISDYRREHDPALQVNLRA